MKFNIITIFPNIFDSYFNESILARAQKEKLVEINVHNLRDFADDKRQTVDDTPYGGGAGMVLKIEPIFNCVESIKNNFKFQISNLPAGRQGFKSNPNDKMFNNAKKNSNNLKFKIPAYQTDRQNSRTILFSAKGKKYTQADAERLKNYDNLILICGRYEGVDERVAENVADEEFSIGEYVLTGGEIPAMILVDSISRLVPKVLGNPQSLEEESFSSSKKLKAKNLTSSKEYPQYTKPEKFNDWKVPDVLISGNHEKIKKWKKEHSK